MRSATQGLDLDRTIAKKVLMYYVKDGTVVKTIYESKGAVAALDVRHTVINIHLDNELRVVVLKIIIYLVVFWIV